LEHPPPIQLHEQLKAGIAAFAALSDHDLLDTVMEMPPDEFEGFLFPANLKALAEMPSGAVPSDPGLNPSPNVPLPPAKKYRESSESGMSGAWSASEEKNFLLTLSTR
jgi:hypothetical protein